MMYVLMVELIYVWFVVVDDEEEVVDVVGIEDYA
jgi:hypothetical protein